MKQMTKRPFPFRRVGAATAAVVCQVLCAAQAADVDDAAASITADDLMRHIRALASDEFEGRAPGTRGEQLTVAYLMDQFTRLGLKPGNPDGTYIQGARLRRSSCTRPGRRAIPGSSSRAATPARILISWPPIRTCAAWPLKAGSR